MAVEVDMSVIQSTWNVPRQRSHTDFLIFRTFDSVHMERAEAKPAGQTSFTPEIEIQSTWNVPRQS